MVARSGFAAVEGCSSAGRDASAAAGRTWLKSIGPLHVHATAGAGCEAEWRAALLDIDLCRPSRLLLTQADSLALIWTSWCGRHASLRLAWRFLIELDLARRTQPVLNVLKALGLPPQHLTTAGHQKRQEQSLPVSNATKAR